MATSRGISQTAILAGVTLLALTAILAPALIGSSAAQRPDADPGASGPETGETRLGLPSSHPAIPPANPARRAPLVLGQVAVRAPAGIAIRPAGAVPELATPPVPVAVPPASEPAPPSKPMDAAPDAVPTAPKAPEDVVSQHAPPPGEVRISLGGIRWLGPAELASVADARYAAADHALPNAPRGAPRATERTPRQDTELGQLAATYAARAARPKAPEPYSDQIEEVAIASLSKPAPRHAPKPRSGRGPADPSTFHMLVIQDRRGRVVDIAMVDGDYKHLTISLQCARGIERAKRQGHIHAGLPGTCGARFVRTGVRDEGAPRVPPSLAQPRFDPNLVPRAQPAVPLDPIAEPSWRDYLPGGRFGPSQ